MPVQSIDLSAVTDATFGGSAVEQINLNGAGIWTAPPSGGNLLWDFPAGMPTSNPYGQTMDAWEYGGLGYADRFWIHPTDKTIHLCFDTVIENTSYHAPDSGCASTGYFARRGSVNGYGQPSMASYSGIYATEPLIVTEGNALLPKTVTVGVHDATNGLYPSITKTLTATVYANRVEVSNQVWLYNPDNPASSRFTFSGVTDNFDFLSGVEPA